MSLSRRSREITTEPPPTAKSTMTQSCMQAPHIPYALPILGFESSINSVSRDTVLDYYRRHYVPSRMKTLVISPFSDEDIKTWIDETFGSVVSENLDPIAVPQWTFPEQSAPAYTQGEVSLASRMRAIRKTTTGNFSTRVFSLDRT